jgi:hypothetical protein
MKCEDCQNDGRSRLLCLSCPVLIKKKKESIQDNYTDISPYLAMGKGY